jgi:hypothetical protein
VVKRSLKLTAAQHKNKRIESTQLAGTLGKICGFPVEKHCFSVLSQNISEET